MSKDALEAFVAQQSDRIDRINNYHDQAGQIGEDYKNVALLCAFDLTVIKEITPHGQFLQLRERCFPKLSERTCQYYTSGLKRIAAKSEQCSDLIEKAVKGDILLLAGPQKETFISAVNKVSDASTAAQLFRATGSLRDPEKTGGFRPNEKHVEKWLKANHPDLAGTKYNDLPPDIQKAFKAQYKPEIDPKLLAESKRQKAVAILDDLAQMLDDNEHKKFWEEPIRIRARKLFHDFHTSLAKLESKKPRSNGGRHANGRKEIQTKPRS